jgi:DNA-binding CsgD family transcriptional regulator
LYSNATFEARTPSVPDAAPSMPASAPPLSGPSGHSGPSGAVPLAAAVSIPAFAGLADLIDDAWLVLSADGGLIGANRAARRLLQAGDTLTIDRGRVVPADPRVRATWRLALDEARAGRRRLLWSRDAEARAVSLQPGGPGAPVLVRIGEDATGRLRRLWAYAQAIGLSAQETRVLEALSDGESPAGVARRHEVGIATVRTQIRGLVTKARVRGMRELLAHMARVVG